MVDNLNVSQDSHINHAIEVAKQIENSGKIQNRKEIAPGIYFSIDTEANIDGEFTSGNGKIIDLKYFNVSEPVHGKNITPRWIAIHFRLGEVTLNNKSAIGVIVKSEAPNAVTMRACLRSGTQENFQDEFFSKYIVAYQNTSTHLDIIKIEDLPEECPLKKIERDLILFLPPFDASLTITDLRAFII